MSSGSAHHAVHLRWAGRALFILLYRRCPRILDAVTIVRPETVVRWHRMGFAAYWRWKSRPRGGRPRIGKEMCDLIRRMSIENPLWGAPKIHGELLKLCIDVAQSTVSINMVPRQGRPLQTWKIFLRNHGEEIASIEKCERMFRSGRTRPAHARSSGSETSLRIRSLAGSIIGTLESRFRKRQLENTGQIVRYLNRSYRVPATSRRSGVV